VSSEPSNHSGNIIGIPFNHFLLWLKGSWTPGKHFALCGPTGEGKTTFAVHTLLQRKWVMALDAKGEDDTLEASGFTRITSFPLPRKIRNDISEGRPARLILGGSARNDREERALRSLMAQGVAAVRQQGGWTVYADEFQVLADLRMFGLGKPIEQLLITARKNRTSVMTSFQAAAWVPKAATRQAAFIALWPTRDRAMIKAIAEAAGRPWREVEEAVDVLPQYYVIIIPSNIHAPMMIVHPPKHEKAGKG
jgi:hypothetical protein